jgi:hypothetical protein
MSLTTIARSFTDAELINRVRAAVAKETYANETLKATDTGKTVIQSGPDFVLQKFLWPVCIASEAEYAYAVDNDNPSPGGDPGVISDADISAAIQVNWPVDVATTPRFQYLKVVESATGPEV